MKKQISIARVLALSALALAATPLAKAESLGFSIQNDGASGDVSVTVLDDMTLQPISDAAITISDFTKGRVDVFEEGSFSLTDVEGVTRSRPITSKPKTITAFKDGYSAVTIAGVQASKITVYLKPIESRSPDVIGSGQVSGWSPTLELFSKPVQVGLVFRSLSAFDLLHFSIAAVISPLKDTIDVFGERKIPSNVVMPRQRIPVYFTSVTVEKPNYRVPLPSGRSTQLTTVEGQIDSGDLIDLAQAGKIRPSALNKFQFERIGLSSPVTPSANFAMNLTADQTLSDAHTVSISRPPFQSDVMVAAVTDIHGDLSALVPTDIKTPITNEDFYSDPKPATLKSTAGAMGQSLAVVSVAITPDLKRLSGIFNAAARANVQPGEFLNSEPLSDSDALPASVHVPAPNHGVGAAVFESKVQEGEILKTFPIWTVYTMPSAGDVSISTSNLPIQQPVMNYAVMQLEFAPSFDELAVDGQTVMTTLKRFTRSSAKVGS